VVEADRVADAALSIANNSDCEASTASFPIVPGLLKLTTYKFPFASTAGPSMPKVYSPAGVTCLL
jgi:hypothetical protein